MIHETPLGLVLRPGDQGMVANVECKLDPDFGRWRNCRGIAADVEADTDSPERVVAAPD
jgi:hypothetical protein